MMIRKPVSGRRPLAVITAGCWWLALPLFVCACGDSSPSTSAAEPETKKSRPAAPARPPVPKKKLIPEPLELSAADFEESDTNRDPFRPYLKEFLTRPEQVAKIQRKVILERYGLDELRLIAVVAGRTRPLAMFRDPSGLGVTVKRGDYISKSAGRVKQILPDKVVVEIQEQLEGGQRVADRTIDLHPQRAGQP
jgi:Tfp pilus assembly protein PilP